MYNSTENPQEKQEIFDIFQEGMKYFFDQGWTKGSGQGTIHHLGYQMREVYEAVLLMREPIINSEINDKTREMVKWYSALGIIYTPEEEIKGVNADILNTMLPGMVTAMFSEINDKTREMVKWYSALGIIYTPEEEIKGVNADILNTMLPGMVTAMLLEKDGTAAQELKQLSALGIIYTPEEEIKGVNADILNTMLPGMVTAMLLEKDGTAAQELKQLNRYLKNSINYAPGLLGGFKEDGSMFHHMQNYPAYAKGAYQGLTPIIYYLGNTPFALDENAYNIVKKAILMTRVYSNKNNWLLTLAYQGLTPIIYYLGNTPFALDENAYNIVKKAILMTRVYSNKNNWLLTLSGRHPENTFKISDEVKSYTYDKSIFK